MIKPLLFLLCAAVLVGCEPAAKKLDAGEPVPDAGSLKVACANSPAPGECRVGTRCGTVYENRAARSVCVDDCDPVAKTGCSSGEVCYPYLLSPDHGICRPGCLTDGNCRPGLGCDLASGQCRCASDDACRTALGGPAFVCQPDGYCGASCSENRDCGCGASCVASQCVATCGRDDDCCGTGQCVGGHCTPAGGGGVGAHCAVPDDCAAGFVCNLNYPKGQCLPIPAGSCAPGVCGPGAECASAKRADGSTAQACGAACDLSSGTGCPTESVCQSIPSNPSAALCFPRCSADADCGAGYRCEAGTGNCRCLTDAACKGWGQGSVCEVATGTCLLAGACLPRGNTCSVAGNCCSGRCSDGALANQCGCALEKARCAVGADCCSGSCSCVGTNCTCDRYDLNCKVGDPCRPGCGAGRGSCGGQLCTAEGTCCAPSATAKCGGSDGCGNTVLCPIDTDCVNGACVPTCQPGGSHRCGTGRSCLSGWCAVCMPTCADSTCGVSCAKQTCGSCSSGWTCQLRVGMVCTNVCTPSCGTRKCGDNGCGGSCGSCATGTACDFGTGQCVSNTPQGTCATDAQCSSGCCRDLTGSGANCVSASYCSSGTNGGGSSTCGSVLSCMSFKAGTGVCSDNVEVTNNCNFQVTCHYTLQGGSNNSGCVYPLPGRSECGFYNPTQVGYTIACTKTDLACDGSVGCQ